MSDIPEEISVAINSGAIKYAEWEWTTCKGMDEEQILEKGFNAGAIFGYHLRDKEVEELNTWITIKNEEAKELIKEINDLKIHNSFLNDENDGFRNVIKELEEQINSLKIIADDE